MNLKMRECQRNSPCDPRRQQPSNLERRAPEAGGAHSLATHPRCTPAACTPTKSHASFRVPWEEAHVRDAASAGAEGLLCCRFNSATEVLQSNGVFTPRQPAER